MAISFNGLVGITFPDGTVQNTAYTGGGGGSGTVTSVSVAPANGLAGVVTNPTTAPTITLSTTVTGVLSGNGSAISAATGTELTSAIGANPVSFATTATSASNATNATNVNGGGAINATPIGNITPSTVSATQFIGLSGGSF
jgi:hypothetical protein